MKVNSCQIVIALMFMLFTQIMAMPQSKVESDISVCELPLPKSIKQAKADFSISYSFLLDEEGTPSNVTKIQDQYVGKTTFFACIEDWRIKGFPRDTKFIAMFKWKHGLGWTEVVVAAKSFNQVIRIKKGIGY
jgi:hypothetical protein